MEAAGEIIMDPLIAKIKREVGNLIDKIMEPVLDSIKREVGYLIGNLKKKRDGIEQSIYMIQEKDEATKKKGQDVYSHVTDTLTKAREMKTKIDGFLDGCSVGWCLDLVSRYRLNKEAVSMKNELDKIQQYISSTDDFQAFTSRARVFEEVMAALKDDRVNMVGIYGLGGVGKTTMAEEIGKQLKIKGHFNEFVMAVVSHNVDWRNIQGRLADKLGLKLEKETEDGRAEELRKRLENGEKNLVILDDLWSKLELKKIGISIAGNAKGCKCKVLLTSRNERVFQDMNVENRSPLGVLDDEEALRLFHTKMGNSVFEIQESVVKDVCKECGRLPIAVVAVAKALNGKTKEAWIDASRRLKESMLESVPDIDPKVYQTLKLSYDLLEPEDARKCFLMCCLFPEDAEISVDELVSYGMGMRVFADYVYTLEHARDSVRSLVETLKNHSLLLDGHRRQNMCKMHDVIRDVAISIAKCEKAFLVKHGAHLKEWPDTDLCERCTAISLWSPNIDELPDHLNCPQLHTLVMQCTNASLRIPETFFNGMKELRLLHMSDMYLRQLSSSLKKLSSLRMLCLEHCRLGDISLVGKYLKSLKILSLVGSDIVKLPVEVKQLTDLRLLDLRKCTKLRVIPPNVISNLIRLEELFISDDFCNWEVESKDRARINASLVELTSLARLVALKIRIPEDVLLPNGLLRLFDRLIRYKVFTVNSLIYGPGFLVSNKAIGPSFVHVTENIKLLLTKAECLNLNNLRGLVNIYPNHQDADGPFFETKYFHVQDCHDLQYLLGKGSWFSQNYICRLGSFSKLRELTVDGCRQMKSLFPPSVGRALKQLQRLQVMRCEMMEEIITNESNGAKDDGLDVVVFGQLDYLQLSNLKRLRSFYPNLKKMSATDPTASCCFAQPLFNEKVVFPALKKLKLLGLPNTEIWDDSKKAESSFVCLQVLKVQLCDSLVNVIPYSMSSRLHQLKKLHIDRCDSIVFVVAPSNLTILYIEECRRLKNIVSSSVACDLVNCAEITERVATENRGEEKEDTTEEDSNFARAQPLFNRMVSLPELEECCVNGFDSRVIFGDSLRPHSFCKLRGLAISRCKRLSIVFPANLVPRLQNLQHLRVEECRELTKVFELEGINASGGGIELLPKLESLHLYYLPKLHCVWNEGPHQIIFAQNLKVETEGCDLLRDDWRKEKGFTSCP